MFDCIYVEGVITRVPNTLDGRDTQHMRPILSTYSILLKKSTKGD